MHDCFWYQVSDCFGDNAHVGVDQIADGFHLTLQRGIHAARHLIDLAILKILYNF